MASHELTVEQAVARLRATLPRVMGAERCVLADAVGRVLAEDVRAALDVPAMANAAMDGYALRVADAARGARLRVAGRALAGHPYGGTLAAGEAVRIMTGAALPAGADAILMQEDARAIGHDSSDAIEVAGDVAPGMHIRPRGEQLRANDLVLARGRRLRSYDVGLAAATGAADVAVTKRLRVGVISTGDELADPRADAPTAAQYDGNRPMLLAALRRAGYEAIDLGIVADREDALRGALAGAGVAGVDALIASGGVAQGDADFVRRVAGEFIALNIRPGRGIVHGRVGLDDAAGAFAFFGLPGNPVAAYLMYRLVVAPLLAHLSGADEETDRPPPLRLPLAAAAQTRGGRIDWRRARLVQHAGALAVQPLALQGSAMLLTLSQADALAAIGPGKTYAAGEAVDVIILDALE